MGDGLHGGSPHEPVRCSAAVPAARASARTGQKLHVHIQLGMCWLEAGVLYGWACHPHHEAWPSAADPAVWHQPWACGGIIQRGSKSSLCIVCLVSNLTAQGVGRAPLPTYAPGQGSSCTTIARRPPGNPTFTGDKQAQSPTHGSSKRCRLAVGAAMCGSPSAGGRPSAGGAAGPLSSAAGAARFSPAVPPLLPVRWGTATRSCGLLS